MVTVRVHSLAKYESILQAIITVVGAQFPPTEGFFCQDDRISAPLLIPEASLEEFRKLVAPIATSTSGM